MLGLILLSLLPAAIAAPLSLGIHFGSGSNNMPTLTLPYATYKAYSYDVTDDYYTFKNIRFAAPPVGDLRWKKPAPPLTEEGVQDGKTGSQCYQALPENLSFGYPFLANLENSSEDCLFLDVMVPGKAARGEAKNLPVLTWIFGGGYVLGSKSFFLYDGNPLLKSADNNIIYVAPNYRLGAFGFLAGPTVNSQGTANVALWDQRAAFQWIQDYIHLFNGDKTSVTAMGESAGAGSIMHHLVGNGGTLDPLFHRAILQSPAFEPMYDPAHLEGDFSKFESLAGCAGKGLSCLRGKTSEELQAANLDVTGDAQYGTFGWGVAVDGIFIRDLPGNELAKGNYWKNVEIMVGHNSNEGYIFANPSVSTDSKVDALLAANFPLAPTDTVKKLDKLYPDASLFTPYSTNFGRLSAIIGDWVVNCNVRYLVEAYAGKAYAYTVSIPPGIHAIDMFLTWWRTDLNIYDFLQVDTDIAFVTERNLATGFQSYLTSFARSGNPNKYRQKNSIPFTIDMPLSTVGEYIKVTDVRWLGFATQQDPDSRKDRCSFWQGGSWAGK